MRRPRRRSETRPAAPWRFLNSPENGRQMSESDNNSCFRFLCCKGRRYWKPLIDQDTFVRIGLGPTASRNKSFSGPQTTYSKHAVNRAFRSGHRHREKGTAPDTPGRLNPQALPITAICMRWSTRDRCPIEDAQPPVPRGGGRGRRSEPTPLQRLRIGSEESIEAAQDGGRRREP